MSLSTVLAKALFDNAAESPEELAFRKGDILMVLEQEQEGGPGWWLCSLHGRQGIAPANRLRLLQTAAPSMPGMDTCRAPSMDSVNIAPRQQAARSDTVASDDGVYLSPQGMAEGLYQSPGASAAPRAGEMWHMEGGRPRSHSSSGTHSRPERDIAMAGRPRSPSVRGRGVENDSLYQTPTGLSPLTAQYHRSHEVLSSDSVYLTPSSVPRASVAPEAQGETSYLMQRESGGQGNSEGCYLVPRAATTAMSNEDLYQTPTGGVVVAAPISGTSGLSVSPHAKVTQDTPNMYQTPTPPGGSRTSPKDPSLPISSSASASGHNHKLSPATANGSPRPQAKGVSKDLDNLGVPSTPPGARGKQLAGVRGSPLLVRIGKGGSPGSPNFGRKPPPPAPPVRGVTKKSTTGPPTPAPKPALPVNLAAFKQPQAQDVGLKMVPVNRDENSKDRHMQDKSRMKDPEVQMVATKVDDKAQQDSNSDKLQDQVYDTPPTNRWQQAPLASCDDEDDTIYNTPRALSLTIGFDQESEIYDVPTNTLNAVVEPENETYSVPASLPIASEGQEEEEDVYSVPSLPGQPVVPAEPEEGASHAQAYSVPSPGKLDVDRVQQHSSCSLEESEPDGGIYDMPSLTLDVPSTSSVRRLSVSSTGSGDVQWRNSVSALIQSAWNTASSASARELAASLTEILSIWKASHAGDAPPPLQQAWSRLSEVLPGLAVCGNGPPNEALRGMVRCTLEDCALLLQSQVRPRLPSQESLSRRPLPALPVPDAQHISSGMGSRKGSWIQERPLPPPPPPAFPLPLPPSSLPPSIGRSEEDDELGNEYAGIGLTPAPPSLPVGDSVGYVKLQGMPEPPAEAQTESNSSQVIPTAETRVKTQCQLSPSPPLPVTLSLEDSELLSFYSSQSLSHLSCLADSIEALFTSVQGNQPPRVFVSRGKSLIVTAHKLVFIGDTLSRLLSSSDLKAKVTTSGARLCQALKAVVVATKGAAQNYPSVPATQEMVDRVAELSQHAAGFAGLLQRLAEIS